MTGTSEATEASLARVKADGLIGLIAAMRPSSDRCGRSWEGATQPSSSGVVAGDLKWVVSADYPFKNARSAYQPIRARHVRGKSVLTFQGTNGAGRHGTGLFHLFAETI